MSSGRSATVFADNCSNRGSWGMQMILRVCEREQPVYPDLLLEKIIECDAYVKAAICSNTTGECNMFMNPCTCLFFI